MKKNVMGYFLGDFFTNSSDHPGHDNQEGHFRGNLFGLFF
jgi:hypothetical protein